MYQTVDPIVVTHDGQVIENVIINAKGTTPAIFVGPYQNVVIRNVIITHENAPGISAIGADGLTIENAYVSNTIAPAYGAHSGDDAAGRNNIEIIESDNVSIDTVYVERGSTGIYALESDQLEIRNLEGYDIRGPFPRGQLVQFDKCAYPVLDTFSVVNPGNTAWTEDNINSYGSINPVIRNGYIEGNNSPTGIGVLIENGTGGYGGLVENVVVRYYVNGAFSAATNSSGVTFKNVWAVDGIAPAEDSTSAGLVGLDGSLIPTLEDWAGRNYRGAPASGQEPFLAFYTSTDDIVYDGAVYQNLAIAGRVAWGWESFAVANFSATTSKPPSAFHVSLPFEVGGDGNDTYDLGNRATMMVDPGGIDTITSTITRSLADNIGIENLRLLGSANINAFGDAGANTLVGNSGNNILRGGAGADKLYGGAGNDLYDLGGDTTDLIVDSAGIDTIQSGITRSLASYLDIERLFLTGTANINATGNALSNNLQGNAGINRLSGGNGNDALQGNGGADVLTGGSGADYFVYLRASDSTPSACDVITDFKDSGADKIKLADVYGPTLSWLGTSSAFTGSGQVKVAASGADVLVSVNLDGNLSTTEMLIRLQGTSISSILASDFVL